MAHDTARRNAGQGRRRQGNTFQLLRRNPQQAGVAAYHRGRVTRAQEAVADTARNREPTARPLRAGLDFAKARGHCAGENPFRWRGHLAALLPKRPHLSRGHHKAMPFAEIPAFMCRLQAVEGMAARALEFAILTAARSGEALGARWHEIDMAGKVWTLSAHRMKGGREHRVPLSPRAVAIVDEMQQARLSEFVFPGVRRGKPLSDRAHWFVLRRMKIDCDDAWLPVLIPGLGWRQHSLLPAMWSRLRLAHAIESKTEAAYRRSDALEKRRKLMAVWATYCTSAPKEARGNVTPLRPAART